MTTNPIEPVLLQHDAGLAILTFNRAEAKNALDVRTAAAFESACKALAADRTVRAVVIRGTGQAFGVGGDLSVLRDAPEQATTMIGHMHAGVQLLAMLDAPVIASLHGVVAGGSLGLSLACDLAVAARGTKFNMAYASVGASCDVSASWSLPRLVGIRRALEIALLAETFDADEALRIGLVNRVVPADQLEMQTLMLARRLASGATLAFGRIKRLMRGAFESDLCSHLREEQDAFVELTHTDDFRQGVAAFLKREVPHFHAR